MKKNNKKNYSMEEMKEVAINKYMFSVFDMLNQRRNYCQNHQKNRSNYFWHSMNDMIESALDERMRAYREMIILVGADMSSYTNHGQISYDTVLDYCHTHNRIEHAVPRFYDVKR